MSESSRDCCVSFDEVSDCHREVAWRTTQNIKISVTGTLANNKPTIKMGRVPKRPSNHSPATSAARMTKTVRQPTCPTTAASVRFLAKGSVFLGATLLWFENDITSPIGDK